MKVEYKVHFVFVRVVGKEVKPGGIVMVGVGEVASRRGSVERMANIARTLVLKIPFMFI